VSIFVLRRNQFVTERHGPLDHGDPAVSGAKRRLSGKSDESGESQRQPPLSLVIVLSNAANQTRSYGFRRQCQRY
jgi:hypothetical protein